MICLVEFGFLHAFEVVGSKKINTMTSSSSCSLQGRRVFFYVSEDPQLCCSLLRDIIFSQFPWYVVNSKQRIIGFIPLALSARSDRTGENV